MPTKTPPPPQHGDVVDNPDGSRTLTQVVGDRDPVQFTIGKEIVYAYDGARRIEAVTSSPRALEGGRPTLVIMNETHHWLSNNDGHEMYNVIARNATKTKGGQARSLAITNAYEPSEDSVAQRRRDTYDEQEAGLAIKTGILYDSLEAPADATMRPKPVRDRSGKLVEPTEQETRDHLAAIVRGVRGDAWWLDIESIVNAIIDKTVPTSQARRFWFNQIVAAEDAWVDPAAIDAAIDSVVKANRAVVGKDDLKVGWRAVMPGEEVVIFFDGSKSDDATAIVGCRISDSYIFTIGVWQKPKGKRGEKWLAPRHAVDKRVDEAFSELNIIGFWADPSHATDDEDGTRYWDEMIDSWHVKYKDQLKSIIADLPNVGTRWGGAITAAMFLKEFADPTPWVHLDIAGTAWLEEAKPFMPKGPSGVAVRTLIDLAMKM